MTEYTIIAKITKIKSDSVFIKGVGKYCYEDSNKKQWNLLEESGDTAKPILISDGTPLSNGISDGMSIALFSQALFHQKPLKLSVQNEKTDGSPEYKIISVEMP